MTKEQEIERGRQAQAIVESPVFRDAIEHLDTEYVSAWRNSPDGETQGRERLYQALKVKEQFISHLQSAIANGRIAAQQIAKLKSTK